MLKRSRSLLCALAISATVVAVVPSTATPAPACATQHSPLRIQVGDALSQSFTPTHDTIRSLEVKLFLRRAFDGRVTATIGLHLPTEEATAEIGARPVEMARAQARVAGAANTSQWVVFRLPEALKLPRVDGRPRLEVELQPGGTDPAWAWISCASSYAGGRAYGRADIGLAGLRVRNDLATFPLSADLQFRVTA